MRMGVLGQRGCQQNVVVTVELLGHPTQPVAAG
jgi:hypothetical protein